MLSKIESLRKKPKAVRVRYAFWMSTLFTAVIAVFWVTSLSVQIQSMSGSVPQADQPGIMARSLSDAGTYFQGRIHSLFHATSGAGVLTGLPATATTTSTTMNFESMLKNNPPDTAPAAPAGQVILIGTTTDASTTSSAPAGTTNP